MVTNSCQFPSTCTWIAAKDTSYEQFESILVNFEQFMLDKNKGNSGHQEGGAKQHLRCGFLQHLIGIPGSFLGVRRETWVWGDLDVCWNSPFPQERALEGAQWMCFAATCAPYFTRESMYKKSRGNPEETLVKFLSLSRERRRHITFQHDLLCCRSTLVCPRDNMGSPCVKYGVNLALSQGQTGLIQGQTQSHPKGNRPTKSCLCTFFLPEFPLGSRGGKSWTCWVGRQDAPRKAPFRKKLRRKTCGVILSELISSLVRLVPSKSLKSLWVWFRTWVFGRRWWGWGHGVIWWKRLNCHALIFNEHLLVRLLAQLQSLALTVAVSIQLHDVARGGAPCCWGRCLQSNSSTVPWRH